MSKYSSIAELLGLDAAPENNLAWHKCLVNGLSKSSVKALAKALDMNQKDLIELVMPGERATVNQNLSAEASNVLYRIAEVLDTLVKKQSLEKAGFWMKSPQAALKGRIPLNLVTTPIGHGYVTAAAERML